MNGWIRLGPCKQMPGTRCCRVATWPRWTPPRSWKTDYGMPRRASIAPWCWDCRETTTMKIKVQDLKKYYGRTRAVDGISFSFSSGQIFGFVGPNGAGKSTTMRILATLDEPTSGDAT